MTQQQTANNQQKSSQEALSREALQERSEELSLKQSGFGNTLKKLFGMRKSVEAASLADTLTKIASFTTSVEEMTKAPFKSSSDELKKAVDQFQRPFKDSVAASTKELRKTVDEVLASLAGTSVDDFMKMAPDEKKKLILRLTPEDQAKLKDALSQTKRQVNTSLNHLRETNGSIEEVLSKNPSREVIKRLANRMTVPTPPKEPFERKEVLKKLTKQANIEIEGEVVELKSQHLLKVLEETKDLLNPPAAGSSTGLVQTSAADITLEIPTALAQELQKMVEAKTNQEKQDLEKALLDYSQNRNADTIEAVTQAEAKLREKFEEAHKILIGVADELQDVAPTYTPASGRHGNTLEVKENALDEKAKELKKQGVDQAVVNELFKAGERLTDAYSKHIVSLIQLDPAAVRSEEIEKTLEQLRFKKQQLLQLEADGNLQTNLSNFMSLSSKHLPLIEDNLQELRKQVEEDRKASSASSTQDAWKSWD